MTANIDIIILSVVRDREQGATLGDLEQAFEGLRPNAVRGIVSWLRARGDLRRHEGGVYSVTTNGKARLGAAEGVFA